MNRKKRLSLSGLVAFSLLAVIFTTSCGGTSYMGDSIPVPIFHKSPSEIDMSEVSSVFLAGFMIESENQIDVEAEAVEFLKKNLSPKAQFLIVFEQPLIFDGNLIKDPTHSVEYTLKKDIKKSSEIWRQVAKSYNVDMVITGKMSLTDEMGKEVVKARKFKDGKEYFISKLEEKRYFTLKMTIYFIGADDGKLVHESTFEKKLGKEAKIQESPEILRALLRETIMDIRSKVIVRKKTSQRFLLR